MALQAINALKTMFAPFLPFTSQKLHEALGFETPLFGQQVIQVVSDARGTHEVLRYDASRTSGRWAFEPLPAGRPLAKPEPLFGKLDESVVEEELARMHK